MTPVETIKSKLDVVSLWRRLYPNSAPKSGRNWIYHSPFRADKKPSFSIFAGGQRFKDHATGEGGDVITFAALAYNCSSADAIRRLGAEVGSLPERRNIVPAIGKKPLDRQEYEKLKKQCLADFTLELGTVMRRFLAAKFIGLEVARALNREGSLGCYYGCPAYIYPHGIKVRHSAESSRSTRWLIGSDGGFPWRYPRLSPATHTVILTEGESDAMLAMSVAPTGRGLRVLAAPNASWRPVQSILDAIGNGRIDPTGKGRRVLVMADNDDAGRKLRMWLKEQMPEFTCYALGSHGQDLCDIGPTELAPILQKLIAP